MVCAEWKRRGDGPILMVVGQNPGKMEVNLGRPFIGPSGGLLRRAVQFWHGAIYVTNAIKCRPLDVKLTLKEVEACLPTLAAEVQEVRPTAMLFLGEHAASAMVRLRDQGFPEGITVVQHSHPAMTLGKGSGVRQGSWIQSCHAAMLKTLNATPPIKVEPLSVFESLPLLLGSDTEYFRNPVWQGANIWTVSDGRRVWTADDPKGGLGAVPLGRTLVFHHAVNELIALRGSGISPPASLHDTMVLAALDDEEGPRALSVLAATKLGYVYDEPKVREMDYDDRTRTYCGHDSRATMLLFAGPYAALAKSSWLYSTLYQPVIPVLADMSFRGLRVDKAKARERHTELSLRLRAVDEELATFKNIKWGSDEHVEQYFREQDYPLEKKTVGGVRFSVDKESLLPLARQGIREATLVLLRRTLTRTMGTYLEKIMDAPDDALRTILNPVGAETGRISSGGQKQVGMTNLQNIPESLRDLFLPPEGMVWVEGDASQHEVRVLAWLAETGLAKRPLSSAVCGSQDFYKYIGEAYLEREPSEDERKAFKTVVLAGQYLARPGTLQRHMEMDGIFMPKDKIEDMMKFIDVQFPTIRWWHDRLFTEARNTGQITTPLGRRRRVFVGQGGVLTPETRRIIVNSPVQGTASDLILFGCLRAQRAGMHMLLTVHDSIDVAAYPNEVKGVAEVLRRAIVKEPLLEDFGVLSVKVKAGPNWGSLKEV